LQGRCAGSFIDNDYPHPKEAPKGTFLPKKTPAEAWELPAKREYQLTSAMVEETIRSRKPSDVPVPDTFPHPHTLHGNFAHIQYPQDARFPDYAFAHDRHPCTQDPNQHRRVNSKIGAKFPQSVYWAGMAMLGVYTAKNLINLVIEVKNPTRDKYVLGSTEVNTTEIPEGKSQTFLWRGKPVFIRHRTPKEIEREAAVNAGELRDPEPDNVRHTPGKAQWVVMVGVCTHLGCIPIANAGDYGGYYCPCHGSHYDTAGRIRKGPAPLNLEIPEHEWTDENTVVIGKV
jgi:ubiquinol-cytochrome c reductase iron-sulfur subunit